MPSEIMKRIHKGNMVALPVYGLTLAGSSALAMVLGLVILQRAFGDATLGDNSFTMEKAAKLAAAAGGYGTLIAPFVAFIGSLCQPKESDTCHNLAKLARQAYYFFLMVFSNVMGFLIAEPCFQPVTKHQENMAVAALGIGQTMILAFMQLFNYAMSTVLSYSESQKSRNEPVVVVPTMFAERCRSIQSTEPMGLPANTAVVSIPNGL